MLKYTKYAVAGIGLFSVCIFLWFWGPQLWEVIQDPVALQQLIDRLGWRGPLVVIFFNTIQIVVAPIPGYPVQIASGFLYGLIWGGLWGAIGLLCGTMVAMWLSRTFGRPVVERMVGRKRLVRWQAASRSTNALLWCVLLLGPTGDLPYYLAGLSQIGYGKMLLLTFFMRVPAAFVTAGIGAGAIFLTWWQITLLIAFLGVMALLFLRYQEQMLAWMDRFVQSRTSVDENNYDKSTAAR